MKGKALMAALLTVSVVLSGCAGQSSGLATAASVENTAPQSGEAAPSEEKSQTLNRSDEFSDRDFEVGYDETAAAMIRLNGTAAACDSDAVKIDGSTVTITDEGTYILRGTLDDGRVVVDTDKSDKVQLVLDNVTIHSETSAPIYILQADKVFVTMAPDSENALTNGGSFEAIDENNIDAVIFSKEDVTLNGSGTLTVASPAGHGIVSKDSLTITSGSYDINCASHGLSGKDDVCIANADLMIVSGKDGIHADNDEDGDTGYVYIQSGSFTISAEGDGISASSDLTIEDGTFVITAGGGSENAESKSSDAWGDFMGGGKHQMSGGKNPGAQAPGQAPGGQNPSGQTADGQNLSSFGSMEAETEQTDSDSTSMKGIKASGSFTVNGGSFTIDSADDAVHSNGSLSVNGGSFAIASGDDAFHADDTLTVTDGVIDISACYEGLEGLHVAVSGGEITLTADDDGLNAAGGTDSSGFTGGRDGMFGGPGMSGASDGTIVISGGKLNITAGGDGIDANGSLEITDGYTVVCGPTQGDTATLDYDTTGVITGGTFIGTGASGMAQTFSSSEQGVIALSVGNQEAGTRITLTDREGNTLVDYAPELAFAVVILSTPEMVSGQVYTVTVGTSSGEFTAS